jgi:hypothetical protein
MRVALRLISILLGIGAICSLIATFIVDHSQLLEALGTFIATAITAVLFEAASELLDVLYQIRDRLPIPAATDLPPVTAGPVPGITQPHPADSV